MTDHGHGAQPEILIDAGELARRFKCTTRHIRKLAADRKIPPSITITRRMVRWRASDIDSFIRGGCDIEKWNAERGIVKPRIAEAG